MKGNWNQHYDKLTEKRLPPSATLAKALLRFEEENITDKCAIDLGCGTGIDTIELLSKGWKVTAIDKQKEALEHLREQARLFFNSNLTIIHHSFECIDLPTVQLVNAAFSLPFCEPQHFNALWKQIINTIITGGRFAGQFFGMNDSWTENNAMNFHNRQQVQELFNSFSIESLEEIETDGKTVRGKEKHWHVFHVVAKKV